MKYLLLCAGLLLTSCATTKPPTAAPPPEAADTLTPDSTLALAPIKLTLHPGDSGSTPQQVVRCRLFGLLPPKKVASDNLTGSKLPRKCKGCTFNYVAGNQTTTTVGKKATAATAEGSTAIASAKKSGPVVVADSGAEVQVATASRGQAAAGKGIHQEQPPAAGPLAGLLRGAGAGLVWLLGIGAAVVFLTSGGPAWLAGLVRRKTNKEA